MNTLNKVTTRNSLRETKRSAKSLKSNLFGRLSQQNRQWRDPQPGGRRLVTGVDISEDDQGYLLKADLPEMKKDDVRVTVEEGILSVSGERKTEKEDHKKQFHRIELSFGTFRRSFTLPEDADSTKVTVDLRDGVLRVHIPTTPIAKSKATRVKVA